MLGVVVASGIATARAANAPMIFSFITLSICTRIFNRGYPVLFPFLIRQAAGEPMYRQ
jgi:hypothetical protein